MLIDLFAYFVGCAMVNPHPTRRDMPFRRLITFPKRASLQLGIDPAFGEVGSVPRAPGKTQWSVDRLLGGPGVSRRIEQAAHRAQGKKTAVWNIGVPGGVK
jgi:hypothetical protein